MCKRYNHARREVLKILYFTSLSNIGCHLFFFYKQCYININQQNFSSVQMLITDSGRFTVITIQNHALLKKNGHLLHVNLFIYLMLLRKSIYHNHKYNDSCIFKED